MSVVVTTMEKHERKSHPINRNIIKLRRLITGKKARDPHKLYPEEYFKQHWLNHHADDCVTFIAALKQKTKKAMLEEWCEDGVKKFERELVQKDLDAMNSPEGIERMKERIRRNLTLRSLCRKMGWDIRKLL